MSTILVTGGAGFIGSHLALHLHSLGHTVVTLDDLSGGSIANLGEPMTTHFNFGSVLDHALLDRLFRRWEFTHVAHLAAYAAEGLSHFIKRFNYQSNLVGSVNLINAAVNHGCQRFLFTSSMAVYGSTPPPFRESTPPAPEDSYGIAKLAVEQELRITRDLFGLDYVIFRPHNVIGEGQNLADRYRNVAGIFMAQLLRGEPMTIFGDGEQQRAFSYVGDMVPVMAEALLAERPQDGPRTFNIGGETPSTINELAAMVAAAMGMEKRVAHLPARHEVRNAFSDHSLLHSVFGRRVPTPVPLALARMAAWAKAAGPPACPKHISQISPDGLEIERNLPAVWKE